MNAIGTEHLVPGFDDPVDRAQCVYRALLNAMARPGAIVSLDTGLRPVGVLGSASLGAAIALLDGDTPLWLDTNADCPAVRDNLRFHCGCPVVADPGDAAFALVARPAEMPPLSAFPPGDDAWPDRSATLILQVEGFDDGDRLALTGPGIEDRASLAVVGLARDFAAQWAANGALYPAGVDLILTAGGRAAALPRSTRLVND